MRLSTGSKKNDRGDGSAVLIHCTLVLEPLCTDCAIERGIDHTRLEEWWGPVRCNDCACAIQPIPTTAQ